jgi:protein FAM32A
MAKSLHNRKKKKSKKSKLEDATRHAIADEKKKAPFVAVEKTPAELKFEETQRRRVCGPLNASFVIHAFFVAPLTLLFTALQQEEKIRRSAEKSHKEKVADFNRKLEELSEHYDIPKVGPG